MMMMKAELRLGNLINAVIKNMEISDGIVTEITKEHVRLNDIVFAYKYLQPVQLTEQRLLDLGFEKRVLYNFITLDKGKLSICMPCNSYKNGRVYFNGWCIMEQVFESVHHLQNIYHSLTGEELTPITK